jgi:hypothetical protein
MHRAACCTATQADMTGGEDLVLELYQLLQRHCALNLEHSLKADDDGENSDDESDEGAVRRLKQQQQQQQRRKTLQHQSGDDVGA